MQTEEPYWLEEAYSSALSALDVGAVGRNKRFEVVTQAIIQAFMDPDGRFVDYGGGHGLFVRSMRDRGFDFWWSDKYAENLYARGFEYVDAGEPVEAVTAFEVFEHLIDPAGEIARMLEMAPNVLFSTMLMPPYLPKPGDWWYYVPETGQHVGIFAEASLRWVAREHSLHFNTNGVGLHLLSKAPVSPLAFRLLSKMRVAGPINCLRGRPALTSADFERLKQDAYF
ncbi:MAG: class I SAM-dependent methyltransferase [Verrucomicrobiota bacterium]